MLLEKKCKKCNILKKIEEFYFHKQNNNYYGTCRTCEQEKKKKSIEKRGGRKYIPQKKKCIDCENSCDARKKILRCYSCSSKYQYKISTKRADNLKKVNEKIHNDPFHKEKLSKNMKKLRNTHDFRKALCESFARSGRISKLHLRTKKQLNLPDCGFISEQVIDKYFVDELNENRKIIIEINGDYVHANPKIYKDSDIIRLPSCVYTAQEKWDSDRLKKEKLESLGYKVVIIWESDNLEEKKKEIYDLLS